MAFADLVANMDGAVRTHLGSVAVFYEPEDVAPVTITGIFDENYTLEAQGNSSVEQITPAVWLQLDQLPVPPDEDEPILTIDGTRYKVRERQPDGMGTILLLLHRVIC